MKRLVVWISTVSLILVGLVGCGTPSPLTHTEFHMDTTCTITVYDRMSMETLTRCFNEIEKYDYYWSRTEEGSDISKLNDRGAYTVRDKTAALLAVAMEYTALTDGAFDITTAPLTDLWKTAETENAMPSDRDVQAALTAVGAQNLTLDGNNATLKNGAAVDLGAIAKGAAADYAAAYLKEHGCEHALLDLGGNIVAMGGKPNGEAFRIGVAHPLRDEEVIATVSVTDSAVVTSGSYERGFSVEGNRYSHILDPHTGYPVDNDLLSVTVLHPEATVADILSTACFVLGYERGTALIERIDGAEAIFVLQDEAVVCTDGVPLVK